MAMFLRSYT